MKLPIALAILLPVVVTSGTVLTANPQGCIDPTAYDADTDFFPEKFIPDETTDLFTITYHNTYKIITNKFSNKSYLLYQCGTTPPESDYHVALPVPHTGGVAITETVQIPPLEILGKRSEIKAYIGNPQYVSSPCLNHLMSDEAGDDEAVEIIFYPDDPWNTALSDEGTADFLSRNPDAIVLTGPLGNVDADRAWGDASTQEKTNVATFDWVRHIFIQNVRPFAVGASLLEIAFTYPIHMFHDGFLSHTDWNVRSSIQPRRNGQRNH
jgi:hypothetical protein